MYLYRQKPNRLWLALVIYPSRKVEKLGGVEFSPFMTLPQLRRIYLEDYRDCQELSLNLALIRLIACDELQIVSLVQNLIARNEKIDAEALDFIETILVYKLPRLSREEIRKMLNVQNVELKQTVFYQEIAAEEQVKGEQILLQRMLTRRFGQLPDEIKNRLNQANAEQIEEWMYRLLDAATLETVFKDSLN